MKALLMEPLWLFAWLWTKWWFWLGLVIAFMLFSSMKESVPRGPTVREVTQSEWFQNEVSWRCQPFVEDRQEWDRCYLAVFEAHYQLAKER